MAEKEKVTGSEGKEKTVKDKQRKRKKRETEKVDQIYYLK